MKFTQANSPVGPLQNSIANFMNQQHSLSGIGTNGNSTMTSHQSGTGEFSGPSINIKTKEKHSAEALRHFAKNTLRKAGLMPRSNQRKLPASMMQQQQQQQNQQQQQQQAYPKQQQSQMASRTPETIRKSMRQNVAQAYQQQLQTNSSDFVDTYGQNGGGIDGDEDNLSGKL